MPDMQEKAEKALEEALKQPSAIRVAVRLQ
jgi:hypothetical protein